MKKTGLVLALAIVFMTSAICVTGSTDAYAASDSGFPSVSEIFSTVEWPDYGFDNFLEDASVVFSVDMWKQIFTYIGDLGTFIVEDTFLGTLTNVTEEQFTGDSAYVNIFVLICTIIALIRIFGAVISYLVNRKTFTKARKQA